MDSRWARDDGGGSGTDMTQASLVEPRLQPALLEVLDNNLQRYRCDDTTMYRTAYIQHLI